MTDKNIKTVLLITSSEDNSLFPFLFEVLFFYFYLSVTIILRQNLILKKLKVCDDVFDFDCLLLYFSLPITGLQKVNNCCIYQNLELKVFHLL